MPFADLHCDTIAWMRHERLAGKTMSLRDTYEMHVNLEKLRASGYYLQNFALFVNTEETKDPWGTVLALAGSPGFEFIYRLRGRTGCQRGY